MRNIYEFIINKFYVKLNWRMLNYNNNVLNCFLIVYREFYNIGEEEYFVYLSLSRSFEI